MDIGVDRVRRDRDPERPGLVEQLVAVAIDGMASNATITLLTNDKATAATARGVLRDLATLPPFDGMTRAIDTAERAVSLDIALRLKSGQTNYKEMGGDLLDFINDLSSTSRRGRGASNNDLRAAAKQVTDWDAVLARCNEFYDRLVSLAIPRIRDFRGMPPKQFDGRGNYTFGLNEQLVFPEINYDKIDTVRGMDITLVTTAENDDHGRALLRALGFPFRRDGQG